MVMSMTADTLCAITYITISADQEHADEPARDARLAMHEPPSWHCDCRGRRGQLRVGEDQDHLCGWEERLKHMPGPS